MEEFIRNIIANGENLAWLSMIPASALIWKLVGLAIAFIKNGTAKKYYHKQTAENKKLEKRIDEIDQKIDEMSEKLIATFNGLEEKKQKVKEQIYEQIFNKKMEVQKIVQEVEPIKEEVVPIEEVEPIREEVVEQEVIVEEKEPVKVRVER